MLVPIYCRANSACCTTVALNMAHCQRRLPLEFNAMDSFQNSFYSSSLHRFHLYSHNSLPTPLIHQSQSPRTNHTKSLILRAAYQALHPSTPPSPFSSTGVSLITGRKLRRRRLRFRSNPSQAHPSARASPACRCSNAGQGNTEGAATVKTAPKKVKRKSEEMMR